MDFMGCRDELLNDFDEKLAYSKGTRCDSDLKTIQLLLPGCVKVEVANRELDRKGVDYIATLRRGGEVFIDAKTREPGCSKYWRPPTVPELALEKWSVIAGGKYGTHDSRKKTGWTLSESSNVDLILYTFNPIDCSDVFLIGFQHLRMVFRQNIHKWEKLYRLKRQDSGSWESEAVFVPAPVVLDSIRQISRQSTIEIL